MNQLVKLLLLTTIISAPLYSDDNLYHEISAQLLVKDRQTASENLSDWTEAQGGYFTIRSLDRITN
jgi:hypothetical protein